MILPHVEESSLFNQLAPGSRDLSADPAIVSLAQTRVAMFRCVSCPAPSNLNEALPGNATAPAFALSNYKGVFGDRNTQFNYTDDDCPYFAGSCIDGGNGIFSPGSGVNLRRVTDGTSKTVMVGEVPYGVNGVTRAANPAYRHNGTNSNAFGSHHVSGAGFVLTDGSVRFLSDDLDGGILNRLAARDDGEPVGDY